MTTDTVEPLVAADFKTGVRGTDKPPGRGDLGMALLFIAPATIGFLASLLVPDDPWLLLQPDQVQPPRDPALHRLRQLRQDRPGQAVLECAGGHARVCLAQHRVPDPARCRDCGVDAAADQVHGHPRHDPAAVPDLQRHRRPGVVLAAGLPDRHRQRLHRAGSGCDKIPFFGDAQLGDPHHRRRERLAPHGLHRPAGLRRAADHPRLRLRGGVHRRQHRVALVLADHPAAAAARCSRWYW